MSSVFIANLEMADEDMTVGIWDSLDQAIADLLDSDLPEQLADDDDGFSVDITRWKLGLYSSAISAATINWERDPDNREVFISTVKMFEHNIPQE
jgi:hypothetical protein